MGSCVLKECGFSVNHQQLHKEKLFKERITSPEEKRFKQLVKSEYFFKMADDFETNSQKNLKSPDFNGIIITTEGNEEGDRIEEDSDKKKQDNKKKQKMPMVYSFGGGEISVRKQGSTEKSENEENLKKNLRKHSKNSENEEKIDNHKNLENNEKIDKLEKNDKFDKGEEGFKKHENKQLKSVLKFAKKKDDNEDMRKSAASSDYKTGFNNKLGFNDKNTSSDFENANEYEQIFKDEGDSDDDEYIEKLFPGSSFKKTPS